MSVRHMPAASPGAADPAAKAVLTEAPAALARHGGRLRDAMRLYPRARTPWLDLSTGVNPRPYPARPASRRARGRLPDPAETAALEAAAAGAFGMAAERVCAVPGLESALHVLAGALGARTVSVVGPTYRGHADAWRTAGARVEPAADLLHALDEDSAAIVLVNPNNPDGRRTSAGTVREAARRLAAQDRWLIVDEAFADADPTLSVAPSAGGRLVVLRSFGKFYGLAGLRLGFVLGAPDLLSRLRARLGDWPVSADAIAAGRQAYPDTRWAERTRHRLARDAARLDALLERAGFTVAGGTPLFRLAEAADAPAWFERLARRGVLARPFAEAPRRLRFGLPPPSGWRRLESALTESVA